MRRDLGPVTIQRKMMDDYWEFIQEFYTVEQDDSYWQELIKAGDEFCKRYKGKFPEDLVIAYMTSREREYATQRKNRGVTDGRI